MKRKRDFQQETIIRLKRKNKELRMEKKSLLEEVIENQEQHEKSRQLLAHYQFLVSKQMNKIFKR